MYCGKCDSIFWCPDIKENHNDSIVITDGKLELYSTRDDLLVNKTIVNKGQDPRSVKETGMKYRLLIIEL